MPQVINFNKPFIAGRETEYIRQAVESGKISGDGIFSKRCHDFFQTRYGIRKALLTTSCTDALEMCALLIDVQPGDEIIMPSFTFVSTANAFVLRGAKIVFADCEPHSPNVDVTTLADLITPRTRAIVLVHYAGIACDMDPVLDLCRTHNLFLIEDAAQAIESFYKGRPLGSIGHLAAFSFHETKNVISGEGGLLAVNDERFLQRAEIIREKGTNRSAFFRGEVDKYGWVDVGSSFLPSEIIAAFLWGQLEHLERIQEKRKALWNVYHSTLEPLESEGHIERPNIPEFATNNGHMYYIVCHDIVARTALIEHLKRNDIYAVFHYQSLHRSPFYASRHDGRALTQSDRYSDCLLRLPMYFELKESEAESIATRISDFFEGR